MENKNNYATFYIVRHGETDWNAKGLVQGQLDIPLNDVGRAQAKDLATELKNIKFDFAFSSDLLRAKETAEIIALEHQLVVETREILRERQFGKIQGKHKSLLEELDKLKDSRSHGENFKHKIAEDVESDEEIVTRLLTFLREAAVAYAGKNVLVTIHGGLMWAFLIHLGLLTYETNAYGVIANTAYIKLKYDGVEFVVEETKGIALASNAIYRTF